MNRTKSIFRVVLFLVTIMPLVDLNRKTNNKVGSIAEFKFKMIEKLRTDSLDSKHKLDLLVEETTKFIDDSSHVKKGIHYLMVLLGLWGVIELVFLLLERRTNVR